MYFVIKLFAPMIARYLLFAFFLLSRLYCLSQDTLTRAPIKYYGSEYFLIEGTAIPASQKESLYDRLPASYKEKVRPPVWDLSKSSAGITVRFRTSSTSIHVKWEVLNNTTMNHMAATGIKGIDLYCRYNGAWQYVNTARPVGKESEANLVNGMTGEMREYKLFLPLYDGVVNLEVGIDSAAAIEKPGPVTGKPILFYGTSITQGGCASRPGMAHTSIISRKLDRTCINFGFSGNGRMEAPIAELMAGTDVLMYVIDCIPNMTLEHINTNTIPLVDIIRAQRSAPIVFVEGTIFEKSFLDGRLNRELHEKNAALKKQYQKLLANGYRDIYYIESEGALGVDHESTVDGVHFTDLGFMRFADFLIAKFAALHLVNDKPAGSK